MKYKPANENETRMIREAYNYRNLSKHGDDHNVHLWFNKETGDLIGTGTEHYEGICVTMECDKKGLLPIIWAKDGVRKTIATPPGFDRVRYVIEEYRKSIDRKV